MVDRMRDDDPGREIDRFVERVERTETMVYGRNASVHSGSTEFVGENSLIVRGSQLVSGLLNVIGRLIVSGLGILEVNGLIDLLGRMRVRGGGGVVVEDGGDIEVIGGEIKAGDVVIRDGKAYIGGMVLDPAEHGGAVTFPNGAQVFTDAETIQLFKGNSVAQISDSYARIQHGGDVIEIDGEGARVSPGAVRPSAAGEAVTAIGINGTGRLRRMPPTDGDVGTP